MVQTASAGGLVHPHLLHLFAALDVLDVDVEHVGQVAVQGVVADALQAIAAPTPGLGQQNAQ